MLCFVSALVAIARNEETAQDEATEMLQDVSLEHGRSNPELGGG